MNKRHVVRSAFALATAGLIIGMITGTASATTIREPAALRARTAMSDSFSYRSSKAMNKKWHEIGSLYNITHWKMSGGAVVHMPSGNHDQSELWTKKVYDLRGATKVKIKLRAKWKLSKKAQDHLTVFVERQHPDPLFTSSYDVYHVSGSSKGKWKSITINAQDAVGYKVKIGFAVITNEADPFWFKGRGARVDSIKVISYQ